MKKWLRRILLCIILVFVVWAGVFYSCAIDSRKYNVVVEGVNCSQFDSCRSTGTGSGVIIAKDGLILTAAHVLKDADRLRVTLPDGRIFRSYEYYEDTDNDVGIIKLLIKFDDYATLWDSDYITRNHVIYTIGNSKGVWDSSIIFGITYNANFRRWAIDKGFKYILARMKIYGGCSGGGVYHYNRLIGIVTKGGSGATLIVPSNTCKQVIEDYRNASEK